eukprot:1098744-Pelagomonas_calceolata.AAC.1
MQRLKTFFPGSATLAYLSWCWVRGGDTFPTCSLSQTVLMLTGSHCLSHCLSPEHADWEPRELPCWIRQEVAMLDQIGSGHAGC